MEVRPASVVLLAFLGIAPASATQPIAVPNETDETRPLQTVDQVGPFGGDVRSLAVHPGRPGTFFLGAADGQLYRSDDAGDSWTRLHPGLGRRHLVVDNLNFHPDDPSTLYAGVWETKGNKGRLFRTLDGGESWSEIPLGAFSSSVRAVAISPSKPEVIALGISEGVILSLDAGKSWERISRGYRSLHNVESIVFDPEDPRTLYVGTWRRGWKTHNSGKKWIPIHEGMAFDSDMFSLLVSPADSRVLFSSACTGIYKSIDRGARWVKLRNGLPKEAKRTRTLHFEPGRPEHLYAGTTIGLYRSLDAGDSWEALLPDVVINTIAVQPDDPDVVLLGTDDAGVLRSKDGGRTFSPANRGFAYRHVVALASSPSRKGVYYAAVASDGDYGGFFVSRDDGASWSPHNAGLGELTARIRTVFSSGRSDTVVLGTNAGVFRGTPGLTDWEMVEGTQGLRVDGLALGNREQSLFVATAQGLFRKEEGKEPAKVDFSVYDGPVYSVLREGGAGHLLAATDMGVFSSQDDGESWTIKVKGLPYKAIHSLHVRGERLLAGTKDGIFYSADRARNWSPAQGLPALEFLAIGSDPRSAQRAFAAESLLGKLYSSDDGGGSWQEVRSSRLFSAITSLAVTDGGAVLAGTISDGIYLIKAKQNLAARE